MGRGGGREEGRKGNYYQFRRVGREAKREIKEERMKEEEEDEMYGEE